MRFYSSNLQVSSHDFVLKALQKNVQNAIFFTMVSGKSESIMQKWGDAWNLLKKSIKKDFLVFKVFKSQCESFTSTRGAHDKHTEPEDGGH